MDAVILGTLVALIVVLFALGVRWERRHKRSTAERISDWVASLVGAVGGFFR